MNSLVFIYAIMFFFGIYFLLLFIFLYLHNKDRLLEDPKFSEEYSLTIVIPCYNAEKEIGETIENLLKSNYMGLKKIIVVDDCSTDNSNEIVKRYTEKNSKVMLIKTPKNTGCAAGAKNYGVKFADTELIGFTDDDSRPEKESMERMIGYFDDLKVAAVTSCVLTENKKNFLEKFQEIDYRVIAWSRKVLDFIGCVYVTNGPLSIYRKSIFDEVGGFDDKNLTEDIELTWNFLSRGYKTKMAYSARVFTFVPKDFGTWVKQRIRWNVGGMQTIYKYKKFFLNKGSNLFGTFVINYVALSFFLALLGFFLFFRFFFINFSKYISSIPYLFSGYNPFLFIDFNFYISFLFILGFVFLILAVIYHRFALKSFSDNKKGILTIFTYIFIYRPLYIVPLLLSLYKIIKRDFRWYTK